MTDVLCSDGVYRKAHLPNCDCEDCWEYRALITLRRDGEAMELYRTEFEGLTEQECFDLLQKGDVEPYRSWRAVLRDRAAKQSSGNKGH